MENTLRTARNFQKWKGESKMKTQQDILEWLRKNEFHNHISFCHWDTKDVTKAIEKYSEASESKVKELEYGNSLLPDAIEQNRIDSIRIQELEDQNKEWEQSFDLYHKACRRGELEYRKIHPDYPGLSRPDTGKMVSNLCDKILELEEENKKLKELIQEAYYSGVNRVVTYEQFLKENNISQ